MGMKAGSKDRRFAQWMKIDTREAPAHAHRSGRA